LAIGIVIGTAFQMMINSLLSDILLPPTLGVILGSNFANLFYLLKSGRNGPNYATVADALSDGAITINYGRFLQLLVSFVAVVLVLFILVKIMQEIHNQVSWRRKWQDCPFCFTRISSRAIRCPFCTSQISGTPPQSPSETTENDAAAPKPDGRGVSPHSYRHQQHKRKSILTAPVPDYETYTRLDSGGLGGTSLM